MDRRRAAGPRGRRDRRRATARAAPARAPTSSRAAGRARSPRRCARAGCCSTPSPTGSPRSPQTRRPTRSTPAPPGAPRSSTRRLVPPPVTPQSPLLALVDSTADVSHPEFAGGNLSTLGGFPLESAHGTETAAIAAAPKNDVGILGVWPGMRAVNVALPNEIRCANSVTGIARAIEQGAAVINMSYGSPAPCFAEYVQLQIATAKGITLVAAAGNELAAGNPLLFPASLPHV